MTERCNYGTCKEETFSGLPVCFLCALRIGDFMHRIFEDYRNTPPWEWDMPNDHVLALHHHAREHDKFRGRTPKIAENSVVYYLMLSPTTVKIGVTTNLRQRLSSLRSEAQYIVAIEPGDRTTEHTRHKQFAEERRDRRREDFHLSDALKAHIDALAPQRAEILSKALGLPAEQFA